MSLLPCPRCGGTGKAPDYRKDGLAIRRARLKMGISLREAARRAGCSPAFLSCIEHGRVSARGPKGTKVSRVVGVKP